MIKRIFLVVALLITAQVAMAQTLSNEQVLEAVIAEKTKGVDDATIAKNLIKKGATSAQIRDVINEYKNKKAADAEADAEEVKRGRDEKQEVDEPVQADSEIVAENSDVYGRNLFNNKLLTFEPAMNIPTPADYILGAGDKVVIDIWGASQQSIEGEISPDGYVVVTGFGPVKLSGMTVDAANEYVKKTLGSSYNGSSITLSLGSTRSVKIEIVGDVVAPGSYTMSAFSTLFNALYTAGGISTMGTLRDIKVFRAGKEVSKIDVYDYIMNGNNTGNIRLQDNDLIIVGAYDAIVEVQGKVKRPMKYEIKEGETLSALMSYVGGFMGDAYTKNVRVTRKNGREYTVHTVEKSDFSNFKLMDGDVVFVDEMINRFSNMVEIKGAVFHPGMYQMDGKIRTLLDLIDAADGLHEDAFLARAIMHRRKADRRLEVISLDLEGIINGTSPDIELRREDVITIPSATEMRGREVLIISGEVNNPGIYEFAENTTIEDFVIQAGGLTRLASEIKVDVYRRVYNPKSATESDTITKVYTFALKDGLVVDGNREFVLEPYDEVNVRKSPAYSPVKNVVINGCVNFEGTYAMTGTNYRLSDLINAAGGLKNSAYTKGVRLYRQATEDEINQRKQVLQKAKIKLYEDHIDSEDKSNYLLSDSILELKLAMENRYVVAVDVEKALEEPESTENLQLRENDIIVVPEYSGTVKISGEVGSPVSISYNKGKKLKYYIKNSGGYTEEANKKAVYVVYMNGAIKKISKFSSKDIQPGCEIVVPRKSDNKKKMSTTEILSISTSVASLSAMIVALINALK
ncbi:MAG: SLBB domain-containing protein [Bacteroidaceae bacterium]|nr:SLBB domain-containing protein [Bacteroidaceae bacterium]